jgi:hypothetical protein
MFSLGVTSVTEKRHMPPLRVAHICSGAALDTLRNSAGGHYQKSGNSGNREATT